MNNKVYMLIAGYKIQPGYNLDDILRFNVKSEELIINRRYYSLSPEAHIVYWLASSDTKPLLEFRVNSLKLFNNIAYESFIWLSLYKSSPYIKEDVNIIEQLSEKPLRYLVAYPMKKSPEWYLLPFEERRSIIGEHIGIARSHKPQGSIRSYTTYAYGIASYEFLVIYEVNSLTDWVDIVEALRYAKARRWIVLEEPVIVGEFIDNLELAYR
ncbi:MAG: chlorite dismutase family protein [Acidilobaceae archaeon]